MQFRRRVTYVPDDPVTYVPGLYQASAQRPLHLTSDLWVVRALPTSLFDMPAVELEHSARFTYLALP
jgi:hypothetical protein